MALAALGVAQHGAALTRRSRFARRTLLAGRAFVAHQLLGLRLDHGERVALGALRTLATFGPIAAVLSVEALAAFLAFGAGAIVTGAILAGTIITVAVAIAVPPAVAAAIPVALVAGPVIARPVVTGTLVTRALVTGAIVAGAIVTGPVVAVAVPVAIVPVLPLTPIPIVAIPVIPIAAVAVTVVTVAVAIAAVVVADLATLGGFVGRHGLGLAAFVLEVDVVAGRKLVAADDLAGRPAGLDGADQPEVVLGVLQIVLGQHAVAGGVRVAGQLLVLFEDVLGVAAHLHAVGAVRVESSIGVLRRLVAAAAATTPIAPTLALHTLEISHNLETVWLFPERLYRRLGLQLFGRGPVSDVKT
jgi:hypothetical protein